MTLAAVRKAASRLTPAQKRKLAREWLAEDVAALPPNPTMEEIERRGEEIRSGKVKALSHAESEARIDRLMAKLKRSYASRLRQ